MSFFGLGDPPLPPDVLRKVADHLDYRTRASLQAVDHEHYNTVALKSVSLPLPDSADRVACVEARGELVYVVSYTDRRCGHSVMNNVTVSVLRDMVVVFRQTESIMMKTSLEDNFQASVLLTVNENLFFVQYHWVADYNGHSMNYEVRNLVMTVIHGVPANLLARADLRIINPIRNEPSVGVSPRRTNWGINRLWLSQQAMHPVVFADCEIAMDGGTSVGLIHIEYPPSFGLHCPRIAQNIIMHRRTTGVSAFGDTVVYITNSTLVVVAGITVRLPPEETQARVRLVSPVMAVVSSKTAVCFVNTVTGHVQKVCTMPADPTFVGNNYSPYFSTLNNATGYQTSVGAYAVGLYYHVSVDHLRTVKVTRFEVL